MSEKISTPHGRTGAWKNESARQRWELFHRAIAHAKQSTVADLDKTEQPVELRERVAPALYIVD
ncbi:MAG: hypothetical protein R3315_12635 [Woeseiaceae bacterium]|nr:hypothetical protein [Woeseiaceae bacterium]